MQHVEITVAGQIDPQWSEWFDNLTIAPAEKGQSTLVGSVADQAALYGILTRLRDLSLALVSLSVASAAIEGQDGREEKGATS
jgi:hypothetical protein